MIHTLGPPIFGFPVFLMTEANLPHFVGNGESGDISPPDSPVRPPVKASSLRRSSGGNDKSSKSIHNKCLSWEVPPHLVTALKHAVVGSKMV